MSLLLSHGADPNRRSGLTNPLIMSREKGHTDIEAALEAAGARETLGAAGDARRRVNRALGGGGRGGKGQCCMS